MAEDTLATTCPACRNVSHVPATHLGAAYTCPRCRVVYVISRLPAAAITLPPQSLPPQSLPPQPLLPQSLPPQSLLPAGPIPPHLTAAPPILPPPVKAQLNSPVGNDADGGNLAKRITIDPQRGRLFGQVFAGMLLGFIGFLIVGGVAIPLYYSRQHVEGAAEDAASEPSIDDPAPALAEANPDSVANPDSASQAATDSPATDSPAMQPPSNPPRVSTGGNAMPQSVDWTSATDEGGVTLGGIRVRVVRAKFGEVLARDAQNQPTPAGFGRFLQIYVQVENRADAELHYVSWYGNRFNFENRPVTARLWDDTGRLYPQHKFDRSATVQGHTVQATAARGERVDDAIIFAVPRQIVNESARTFRLELPGGAVGTRFFYRFEIPRSMLSGF